MDDTYKDIANNENKIRDRLLDTSLLLGSLPVAALANAGINNYYDKNRKKEFNKEILKINNEFDNTTNEIKNLINSIHEQRKEIKGRYNNIYKEKKKNYINDDYVFDKDFAKWTNGFLNKRDAELKPLDVLEKNLNNEYSEAASKYFKDVDNLRNSLRKKYNTIGKKVLRYLPAALPIYTTYNLIKNW